MSRKNMRVRVADDGHLEVVDPGFDALTLLRAIDPSFRIQREKLAGLSSPAFMHLRQAGCGLSSGEVMSNPDDVLWNAHDEAITRWKTGPSAHQEAHGQASVMDLKIEIARRTLSACQLCGRKCGVNRMEGELGMCGLGPDGIVAEHFVHIAEEAPINPSLLLSLSGCGLRCRFCQQGEILDPFWVVGEKLDAVLWSRLCTRGARSLSFAGGNPDESLYAILLFLVASPRNWKLPIVWNCNAYGTPETIKLLDGVADAYIPDFKFAAETCGLALSSAPDYPSSAVAAISTMVEQGVPVIVRILVLPGHFACCHAPALEFLRTLPQRNLFISVRGQYCPDCQITSNDGELARRVTPQETETVRRMAADLGLSLLP